MYKVIVYDKKGKISKYVFFSVNESRKKQVYTDGLSASNTYYKEEFFIQL